MSYDDGAYLQACIPVRDWGSSGIGFKYIFINYLYGTDLILDPGMITVSNSWNYILAKDLKKPNVFNILLDI